jgi:REP-associated tyrosine transposase
MQEYSTPDAILGPVLRVAMPRAPRLYAPGVTVHVVARCNNREFYIVTPEDFERILNKLQGMVGAYEVTLYAYTLLSNHVHLLLCAPEAGALAQPMRWFMTETAKAFHRVRQRQGHFWQRRYRTCLVEHDFYALAALRYLDRNPVRAGLVQTPAAYPWSSCAVYAHGASNPLITMHPSYLALGPDPEIRQRQYAALLAPSTDPQLDARNPCWTTRRAVGSPDFVARYTRRPGRPRMAWEPP